MNSSFQRYCDAVFISITLFCENCDAFLEPADYPKDGWDERLARHAWESGWVIGDDYDAYCPACTEKAGRDDPQQV